MQKNKKTRVLSTLIALVVAGCGITLVKSSEKKEVSDIPYVRMSKILELKDEFLNPKQQERNILNQIGCRDNEHNFKIINPVNNEKYCEADLICYGCGTKAHINYNENCNHYFRLTENNENKAKYECSHCDSYIEMEIKSKKEDNKLNYICQVCGNEKTINESQLKLIPHIFDYKIMPCDVCKLDTRFLHESKSEYNHLKNVENYELNTITNRIKQDINEDHNYVLESFYQDDNTIYAVYNCRDCNKELIASYTIDCNHKFTKDIDNNYTCENCNSKIYLENSKQLTRTK